MNLPLTPASLWKERYEALRQHFVQNRPLLAVAPLELTVLLHHGVAGWMLRWHSCPPAAPKPSAPSPPLGGPPDVLVLQQALTRLIAHMTTPHLHPPQKL